MSEVTGDPESGIAGARKDDSGKAPIHRGGFGYFPRAIEAISRVSLFGATKYAWNGWRHVPDGFNRYTDAMVRHLAAEAKGEVLDADSGLPHAWHVTWNALARLELQISADEEKTNITEASEYLKEHG